MSIDKEVILLSILAKRHALFGIQKKQKLLWHK